MNFNRITRAYSIQVYINFISSPLFFHLSFSFRCFRSFPSEKYIIQNGMKINYLYCNITFISLIEAITFNCFHPHPKIIHIFLCAGKTVGLCLCWFFGSSSSRSLRLSAKLSVLIRICVWFGSRSCSLLIWDTSNTRLSMADSHMHSSFAQARAKHNPAEKGLKKTHHIKAPTTTRTSSININGIPFALV